MGPGVDTYEGMVIGEHVLDTDIEMNPAKTKKLTNIRSHSESIKNQKANTKYK